jgi:cbb3-type cytochrome oxidase subunit 3
MPNIGAWRFRGAVFLLAFILFWLSYFARDNLPEWGRSALTLLASILLIIYLILLLRPRKRNQ